MVRNPDRFASLRKAGVRLWDLAAPSEPGPPAGAVLVHTIPPLPERDSARIRAVVTDLAPRRVVYISSTGVYGALSHVNAESPAAPDDDKAVARFEEERWVASRPWRSLILRPAAIYGPGRGVHVRVREGRPLRDGGMRVVSRIHVEDLAAITEAGVFSDLEGAWPVADECPATSAEVAAWCAELWGLEKPAAGPEALGGDRRVDGREVLERLGVRLQYKSYRAGVSAGPDRKSEETRLV